MDLDYLQKLPKLLAETPSSTIGNLLIIILNLLFNYLLQ